MRHRTLSETGIGAKLAILSAAVFLGVCATYVIVWSSLERLSATVEKQSSASSIAAASYDLQKRVYVSWLSLYRLHDAPAAKSGGAAQSGEVRDESDYLSSAMEADGSLGLLLGVSTDPKSSEAIKNLGEAYAVFKADADKAAAALALGRSDAPELFQYAGLSFSVLESQLTALSNLVRQSSVAVSDGGKLAAAKALRDLALVCILVLAVELALALVIRRSITLPLGVLVAAVDAAGSGDFSIAAVEAGGGELGQIASSLNRLVFDLRSLVSTVKDRLGALEGAGGALLSSIDQVGGAASEISAGVSSSRSMLDEELAAVEELSSFVAAIAKGLDVQEAELSDQASLIGDSSSAVQEMIANVDSVARNARSAAEASELLASEGSGGRERIDEVDAAVAAIVVSSESLGEAAALIRDIADRTALLAMNASIEAAHAGAEGRGFGVVADEIRKLAEQANSRAADISSDLDRVTRSIAELREASSSAVASFSSILDRSLSLGGSVRAIGDAMAEQMEGGKVLLGSLAKLDELTGRIARGSESISAERTAALEGVGRLKEATTAVVRNGESIVSSAAAISGAIEQASLHGSLNAKLIAETRAAADRFRT